VSSTGDWGRFSFAFFRKKKCFWRTVFLLSARCSDLKDSAMTEAAVREDLRRKWVSMGSSSSSAPASRGRLKKDIDRGEMGKVLKRWKRPGPTTLHCHSNKAVRCASAGAETGCGSPQRPTHPAKQYKRLQSTTDTVYGGGAEPRYVGRFGKRRIRGMALASSMMPAAHS
jgi:hypothetical protein